MGRLCSGTSSPVSLSRHSVVVVVGGGALMPPPGVKLQRLCCCWNGFLKHQFSGPETLVQVQVHRNIGALVLDTLVSHREELTGTGHFLSLSDNKKTCSSLNFSSN